MLFEQPEPIPFACPNRIADEEFFSIRQAIADVIASGHLILGPFVEKFEQEFSRFLSPMIPFVVAVGSGTDALILGIQALDLPRGATVLVAANEGGFATSAILACGLIPHIVDVNIATRAIDIAILNTYWTTNVSAVLVTHLHGLQSDILEIKAFCKSRGVALIEDCSQVHGARFNDIHVGLAGDIATFSFYPTKNLGCFGDGGAVVTRSPDIAEKIRILREYGWGERYKITLPNGRNSRMDAIQAAILSARLPFLDCNNQKRLQIIHQYQTALRNTSATIFSAKEGFVAHHAVITSSNIADLKTMLRVNNIQFGHHYPYLTIDMPGLKGNMQGNFHNALLLRDTSLSLPCFPTLTSVEISKVCKVLQSWSHE